MHDPPGSPSRIPFALNTIYVGISRQQSSLKGNIYISRASYAAYINPRKIDREKKLENSMVSVWHKVVGGLEMFQGIAFG